MRALDEEIIERGAAPVPRGTGPHAGGDHLARKAVPELAMLALDERVRKAADRLGFLLLPGDDDLGL